MPDSKYGRFGPLVSAIDEGTSSVRFIVFCPRTSEMVTVHQIPLKGIYPQEGYVEQDPTEIMNLIYKCFEGAFQKLSQLEVDPADVVAVGITNQRETAVAWDRVTGKPLYNALVWSDMRTQSIVDRLKKEFPNSVLERLKQLSGLPLTPTFSALKYMWLYEEVEEVKAAAQENRLCFGTIDSWVIYNLTGGRSNGVFATDCTNASRTMLMNLDTLKWDSELCEFFKIDVQWLPEIKSSSEVYGKISSGFLKGIPISGCLGDQHAALLGHMCLEPGQIKNTYGTGCFLVCNTGSIKVVSRHGLISTVAFKLGKNAPTMYAIEGSVAVAGAAFNWLRDNLEILGDAKSAEAIAASVTEDNDLYFVPAFSGLYAPYWDPNARGVIIGITEGTKDSHLIRAALEAVCFQTRDVLEAMKKDCDFPLKELLVDGGMTKNNLLMQLQADLTGVPVVRPSNSEMTALGVAFAAGSADEIGIWNCERVTALPDKIFFPSISSRERDIRYNKWKDAVHRSFNWNVDA